jgi:thioredoxin-dependent peroxiredoxin
MKLSLGDKAPDFELKDQNGKTHRLSDYRGKTVILYFYPKDDTPGCTKEACSFRDSYADIKKVAVILGVSIDDEASHKKFEEKHSLPFTLLADPDKKVVKLYGVWGEKSMYGKKYMGTIRTTFIIDEKGIIRRIFENVKVDTHTAEVMKEI